MRVADLWRNRQWRFLLNLIDHLPVNSYFVEAQLNDEDLAARLAGQPESKPGGPRISEWSPEQAALARLTDRITELLVATVRINGGQAQLAFEPRPRTALDRAREQALERRHRALVDRLLKPDDNTEG